MQIYKGLFVRFRPISYFFRKDWYGNRLKSIRMQDMDYYKDYEMLIDLGAITIGKRVKGEINHANIRS